MRLSLLARFMLLSIVGMLCLMPLWYYIAPMLAAPVFYAAGESWFALFNWVAGYQRTGTTATLVTHLVIYTQKGGAMVAGKLAPIVDYRLQGYGLVMFWSLMLASRPRGWGWKLLLGSVVMLAVQAVGVSLQWFNDVLNRAGPEVVAQTGLPGWLADLVAFGYHFNLFIFTALVPVLLWFAMNRDFLRRLWSQLTQAHSSSPPVE